MPKLTAVQAILFVPLAGPSAKRWLRACYDFAARRGYNVVSVVRNWPDVFEMIRADRATVVVVGRREHLPRERSPRLEVVTEEHASSVKGVVVPPQNRRRVVRRRV